MTARRPLAVLPAPYVTQCYGCGGVDPDCLPWLTAVDESVVYPTAAMMDDASYSMTLFMSAVKKGLDGLCVTRQY